MLALGRPHCEVLFNHSTVAIPQLGMEQRFAHLPLLLLYMCSLRLGVSIISKLSQFFVIQTSGGGDWSVGVNITTFGIGRINGVREKWCPIVGWQNSLVSGGMGPQWPNKGKQRSAYSPQAAVSRPLL